MRIFRANLSNILIFISSFIFFSNANADEICDMKLTSCPEEYNNKTVVVPKKVIALASSFLVCEPTNVIEGKNGVGSSPSIMFVIDHSGSMSGITGVTEEPTDLSGTRFTVTKAIIDTISRKFPKAEIGIVVFQNVLCFDTRNLKYSVPLPDGYKYPAAIKEQAYLPLIQLDTTLSGGEKGIDVLKNVLETKKITVTKNSGGTLNTTDLVYKPQFQPDGYTNINTAFDAAKVAMQSAKNPKRNQFIIFLSDGEAKPTESSEILHGGKESDDFVNGVNVPTTFTVYFVPAGESVPYSISEMTKSIKKNNYSESNPLSDVWGIQTNYNTLLDILINKAINPIISTVKSEPTKLVLNNVTYEKYNPTDSTFTISNLKLNEEITHFDLKINYKVRDLSSTEIKDSLVNVKFDILRSDEKAQSDGVELICHDTIYYDVSVNVIKGNASENGPEESIIEFSRNNSSHGDLAVYFTISGTATMGVDYKSSAMDSVVFTGNNTTLRVNITPYADSIKEDAETVKFQILSKKDGRVIKYNAGSPNMAETVIEDHFIEKRDPDTITVTIVPNPLPINGAEYSENLKYYFKNIIKDYSKGALIAIKSTHKLKPVSEDPDVYGKVRIYDAVGNIINNVNIVKGNDNDTIYYGSLWDGTNDNKRKVGGGMYLAKFQIESTTGQIKKYSRKIGIK